MTDEKKICSPEESDQPLRRPKDALVLKTNENTALTKETKRTAFLKIVSQDLDDYSTITFTPEEVKKATAYVSRLKTGSAAVVPLLCGGERCPYKAKCPFFEMNKPPLGKQCLLELQLMRQWIIGYMEEYDVDPNNFTEIGYCNELGEIEVYLWRLSNNLAKPENADLMIEQSVGSDRSGQAIFQKQISPLMLMKEKLYNRRSKIIKLMVGDRQERYKKEAALKERGEKDSSTRQAETRRKIEDLKRKLDNISPSSAPKEEEKQILTPDALLFSEDKE